MSQGRPDDLRKTIEELRNPSGIIDGKNWLGHHEGKQDQRIDEMLLKGATEQDIARDLIQRGLSKRDLSTAIKRVKIHFPGKWEQNKDQTERLIWIPLTIGVFERIIISVLVGYNVSGSAAFVGAWMTIKAIGG